MQKSTWCTIPLSIVLSSEAWCGPQTTIRASVDSTGLEADDYSEKPAISDDGHCVAFVSSATNLVYGDLNGVPDVFVHDLHTGATTRVSVDSSGIEANGECAVPEISATGRYVVFASLASNLVPGDTNDSYDIFVHDRLTSQTTRVSVASSGDQANGHSVWCDISPGGRHVAYASGATNLVASDSNDLWDVFVHDRQTGTTERASVDSAGNEGNGHSGWEAPSRLAADGNIVAFVSQATNLVAGDTNAARDVFVRDLQAGRTHRVSVSSTGEQGNALSSVPSISDSGQLVTFNSNATNLVPGDTNGAADVFLKDRSTGTTTRVTLDSMGNQTGGGVGGRISPDGRFVAFASPVDDILPGDTNNAWDVFLRDLFLQETTRASITWDGNESSDHGHSEGCSVSSHGLFVCFTSSADNLVWPDTNDAVDIFVRVRVAPVGVPYCRGDGTDGTCPCGNPGFPNEGCANSGGSGGLLQAEGSTIADADYVVFEASGLLSFQPALLFVGLNAINNGNGLVFGDGLRCAGGSVVRLGIQAPDSSGDASWGPGLGGMGGWGAGDTRRFQAWYRDPGGPCGTGFNLTNGLEVVFSP